MSRWLEAFLCDVLGWHDMEEVRVEHEYTIRFRLNSPGTRLSFIESPALGPRLCRYECKRNGCDEARDQIAQFEQQVLREQMVARAMKCGADAVADD